MLNMQGIRAIAFDADDTLWELQNHFEAVEHEYCRLLAPWGCSDEVSAALFATETANMADMGYGCKAFTISLVENAVRVSHGAVTGDIIGRIVELGKSLLHLDATPLEGVAETLRYLHDQTLHLANRGLTPDEIAEEMKLPASLASQFNCRGYYGTLSHNVKAQYDLYFGWFNGNPAHLNSLPPSELGSKYVEAIGGADKVLEVAKASYAKGEYRWVATLLDNLVFAEPENKEARRLLADTYTQLGYQAESGPWRNFYLTGARDLFKKDVPYTSQLINDGVLAQMDMGTLLDYCAIQLNGEKAAGKEAVININFTDTKEKVMLMLNNGVLNHRLDSQDEKADLTLEIEKMDFIKLFFGRTDLQTLLKTNKVRTTGNTQAMDVICSAYEPADPNFKIVLP